MIPYLRFWIWLSAFASLAGWTLSALGQLNRPGYAVCFGVFALCVFVWRKELAAGAGKNRFCLKKIVRRLRRPLPFCFAALAFLVFLGGAFYPASNYTGLTYRVGRVLQWLAHEHWFWINTEDFRMNDRACGIEWLSAPLLIFTHSTRGLFLINFLPYLLLPGLIFNLLTQLGVRARVAWQWMWLLPTAYNFLLQAGGTANDTFPTVYALAAIAFGLRAWKTRQPADLWYSLLAAALLTGAKASNLPLLLPWAILIFPVLPLLRRKPAVTVLVILLAAVVSFAPTAILNIHYLGDWSGLSIERTGMSMKNPVIGIWGNAFLLVLDNFVPTLFPLAGWWNEHALSLLPHFLTAPMLANFEPGFLWVGELPTEDWSGLGFGISVLLVVSVVAGFFAGRRLNPPETNNQIVPRAYLRFVVITPWLALLAFCMKSGMVTPNRLIAPYYPLLLPLLLLGAGQSRIVRRCWWQALAGGTLILSLVVLVLLPDRPLWPAKAVLAKLVAQHPDQHQLARALEVYTVYAKRSDPLADIRALLPPEVNTVGFIGGEDDCDISLWLPLGGRRVEHFRLRDPAERFRQAHVEFVVVGGLNLQLRGRTFSDWQQQTGAELIATGTATLKVSEGPQSWFIVRIKP
jgi:hypothetical protein